MKQITLNHEPFIRIFSNQKEGCNIVSIGKKNNFQTKFKINFSKQKHSFGYNLPPINEMCKMFKTVMDLVFKNKPIKGNKLKQFYQALIR